MLGLQQFVLMGRFQSHGLKNIFETLSFPLIFLSKLCFSCRNSRWIAGGIVLRHRSQGLSKSRKAREATNQFSLAIMSDLFENPLLRVPNQMLWSLLLNKWIKRQVDWRLFCHCSRTRVTLRKALLWYHRCCNGHSLCSWEYCTGIQSCKLVRN